jgi:pyruvate/2-oxoglutarate dehydrogenase complex dihydrolipoamide dehydrogenase (E3) component
MAYDYQLIIIGGGSGGLTAADLAAELGFKKVLLVEAERQLGGECLHTGCVPSKSLLHAAKQYAAGHKKLDVWHDIQESISFIQDRSDNDANFINRGINVLHGAATFIDDHTVTVGGKTITSKYFLIATGSSPAVPQVFTSLSTTVHTNETIFSLAKTPKSLTIIGGGPIGCEMASAFSLLGCKVSIVQSADRLLPREEPEISEMLTNQLKRQGVEVDVQATVNACAATKSSVGVEITSGNKNSTLSSEVLLVAVGRVPRTNLDLSNAGVAFDTDGIAINKYFQTSRSHIYAVGDCTPSPKFTHLAAHQAGIALSNMVSPLFKSSGSRLDTVPWITYTLPEIARIGASAQELTARNISFQTVEVMLNEIDRAVTDKQQTGFVRAYVKPTGKLLGAVIVAETSSELLAPLSHVYYHNQPLQSLAKTVFPYPTLSSGLNILGSKFAVKRATRSKIIRSVTKSWR